MRAAGGAPTHLYRGAGSSWTVIAEADSRFRPAPLHRFVRVHPIAGAPGLLEALTPVRHHLVSVGVGGFGDCRSGLGSRSPARRDLPAFPSTWASYLQVCTQRP